MSNVGVGDTSSSFGLKIYELQSINSKSWKLIEDKGARVLIASIDNFLASVDELIFESFLKHVKVLFLLG